MYGFLFNFFSFNLFGGSKIILTTNIVAEILCESMNVTDFRMLRRSLSGIRLVSDLNDSNEQTAGRKMSNTFQEKCKKLSPYETDPV